MDIQLQELIDKIKKDGIESAAEEASRLKSQAEEQAKRIVEAAQRDAAAVITKGKADAERLEKAGVVALEQASRNLVLAFKGEIQALLDTIIAQRLKESYTEDTLKQVLPELISAWAAKGRDKLDLILSEEALKSLEAYFDGQLAAVLAQGLELKSSRNLTAGFRIAHKDGSAYYDFSAESVGALLSAYLNPRLGEILKRAVKGS
ncbi:MAG: V-type ATP synthase subunit E [Treponema sp.]|jgi:V/A-type H+-transporting ATPase subunit E|nr:V-type ATP synthase subunit E [Treponema sp.]